MAIRLTRGQLRDIIREEARRAQKKPIVVTQRMLRRLVKEATSGPFAGTDASVIDLGEKAYELPEDALQALMELPFFQDYLQDEIDYAGDARSAVYNSLNVDDTNGSWTVSDIDSMRFVYQWDGSRWTRTR